MQNLKLGDVYASANQQKEQEFRRLKHSYKNEKQKFEDWEFPPGKDALGDLDYLKSHPDAEIFWIRPHELVRKWDNDANAKPYFIGPKGVGRFDIKQGGLGDCWYLSGLAQLATEKELFRVVVPDDNRIGFDDGEYSGAFHFRFWRAGVWTEVVIDDRLPCAKNYEGVPYLITARVANNEFWTALAEKAFAKSYGSYQQIEGGLQSEALEDFTGGISILDAWDGDDKDGLEELIAAMKDTLRRAHKRKSLIGFGSKSEPSEEEGEDEEDENAEKSQKGDGNDEVEEEGSKDDEIDHPEPLSPEGIAGGHAYSVTAIEELEDNKGKSHFLIRLRNPWGCYEWKGKWSDLDDGSWATVPKDLRGRGTPGADILGGGCDDGEFWISVEDVIQLFDQVSICYWSPLAYEGKLSQIKHASWDMKMLKGNWSNAEEIHPDEVKADLAKLQNVTVKLSRSKDSTDPLFEESDSSECTMVVALIYELYNCSGAHESMPNIGFRVFKVPEDRGDKPYDVEFFETATEITESIPQSYQMREVNQFFTLEEGTYCIVPFVQYQAPEGGCDPVQLPFLLRIFSERKISVD